MTFTVVARCPETLALGICLATSPLGVSSRCPHLLGGVAAISSQSYSNPWLGVIGMDLAKSKIKPPKIIEILRSYDEHFDYRQVGIVNIDGEVAVHTGHKSENYFGHKTGDGFVTMGNNLAGPEVVEAMHAAFSTASSGIRFEERLLRTIEAGYAAGGEKIGQMSAGLFVALPGRRSRTDIRIDMAKPTPRDGGDAVLDLRRAYDAYAPMIEYYADHWPANPTVKSRDWLESMTGKRIYANEYLNPPETV